MIAGIVTWGQLALPVRIVRRLLIRMVDCVEFDLQKPGAGLLSQVTEDSQIVDQNDSEKGLAQASRVLIILLPQVARRNRPYEKRQ